MNESQYNNFIKNVSQQQIAGQHSRNYQNLSSKTHTDSMIYNNQNHLSHQSKTLNTGNSRPMTSSSGKIQTKKKNPSAQFQNSQMHSSF